MATTARRLLKMIAAILIIAPLALALVMVLPPGGLIVLAPGAEWQLAALFLGPIVVGLVLWRLAGVIR